MFSASASYLRLQNEYYLMHYHQGHIFYTSLKPYHSWSGYFFASRKGSLFVKVVDEVFREYYLKYKDYSKNIIVESIQIPPLFFKRLNLNISEKTCMDIFPFSKSV